MLSPRTRFRLTGRRRTLLLTLAALLTVLVLAVQAGSGSGAAASSLPAQSHGAQLLDAPADISELPVPPTVPADGKCTNPTGCVSGAWGAIGSPGFYWDSRYVLLGVTYAGAPSSGPTSVYSGPQVLVERTDGGRFPDGDAWKCITCGAAIGSGVVTSDFNYPPPHALPGDEKILVGNGILECANPDGGFYQVTDPRCTPRNTRVYPVYWGSTPLGGTSTATPYGNGREWRLSPDGVHLAWDSLETSGTSLVEFPFEGRLTWDQAKQRYDLTSVYLLYNSSPAYAPWVVKNGTRLVFNPKAMIGELRGWSSDGRSILGIQSYESDSVDAWETSLATAGATPLTSHAEYTDPMSMSPNGQWLLAEEVAGSGRLDFFSAMQGIPPVTDLIATGYVSQIRNNSNRRFFLPWLVSTSTSRSEQINAGSDPDWNAAADPVWLADSTAVVYAENLACGANPTPHQCAGSAEPGGRNSRVMIARFPTLRPSRAVAPSPASDVIPWATPYTPGQALPTEALSIPSGTYTIAGAVCGSATVKLTVTAGRVEAVAATYRNYSFDGKHIINGTESVYYDPPPAAAGNVTWKENLTLSGQQTGRKVTSANGFTLGLSTLYFNNFQATGTLTTVIDGQTYSQPANGT